MLSKKRKPIYNKYKWDMPETDSSVLHYDQMGFFKEEDYYEENIPIELNAEMSSAIGPQQVISSILRELGLTRTADMFLFDMFSIRNFTSDIGKKNNIESKQNVLAMLDISDLIDIEQDEDDLIISGFILDANREWTNEECEDTTGPIQTIGHQNGEGLFCSVCNTEYIDLNKIILAPTIGINPYVLNPTNAVDDLIKLAKPHITLTPICPNCYCDEAASSLSNRSARNISPIFVGYDQNKHIVPLLPMCYKTEMNEKSNSLHNLTSILFWPKEDQDIICKNKLTEINTIIKKSESKKTKKSEA